MPATDIHPPAPVRRSRFLSSVLMMVGAAFGAFSAGCATTRQVDLVANADKTINPSRLGGSAPLEVYAFFLKKRDAFDAVDKKVGDFLTDDVKAGLKPPEFLAADAVAVHRIRVLPRVEGRVEAKKPPLEVPIDAKFVGLVAGFQTHDDGDKDERWRLVLDLAQGGPPVFFVSGKRLLTEAEATKAAEPKPAEPPKAEAPKPDSGKGGNEPPAAR